MVTTNNDNNNNNNNDNNNRNDNNNNNNNNNGSELRKSSNGPQKMQGSPTTLVHLALKKALSYPGRWACWSSSGNDALKGTSPLIFHHPGIP